MIRTKTSYQDDAMSAIEPMWFYIAVPAVLVSILILIKLKQRETNTIPIDNKLPDKTKKPIEIHQDEAKEEMSTEVRENAAEIVTSGDNKPQGCNNYLGYLYMKKAPNEMHIPTECYRCANLLKCLYSPVVVEKVYGQ